MWFFSSKAFLAFVYIITVQTSTVKEIVFFIVNSKYSLWATTLQYTIH